MTTTYSFHTAIDHQIFTIANPGNLQAKAQEMAKAIEHRGTVRVYVHNGVGIVAALLMRNGAAHDILRDDYMKFKGKAAEIRTEYGLVD